jgi:hypothetical protein
MIAIIPLILLMGLGYLSRKGGILKKGDERVLSAYVYYFALPSLFFVTLSQTAFSAQNIKFIWVGILPLLFFLGVYVLIYFLSPRSSEIIYLLIVSTTFGSYAFFGIPFIAFTFPEQGEEIATFAASFLSMAGVIMSLTTLEFYRTGESSLIRALTTVGKKLSRNPLIISILCGILFSLLGLPLHSVAEETLHILGRTTSPVIIVMLGASLYGRKYGNLVTAGALSALRIIVFPIFALIITALFGLPELQQTTLVLMHSMPAAVSLIVLSERYAFHQKTIASMILITSVGALVHLNLWLWMLGY